MLLGVTSRNSRPLSHPAQRLMYESREIVSLYILLRARSFAQISATDNDQ